MAKYRLVKYTKLIDDREVSIYAIERRIFNLFWFRLYWYYVEKTAWIKYREVARIHEVLSTATT